MGWMVHTLGLIDTLRHAGSLRRLDCGGPLEDTAVLRLLSAIHMRAMALKAPTTPLGAWEAMWDTNRLDAAAADYVAEWADRFDLADPTRPFMQSPGFSQASGVQPIDDLVTQCRLFPVRTPGPLAPADAALALLVAQAWDGGGIKPCGAHDARAQKGRLYPPATLKGLAVMGGFGSWVAEADTLARPLLLATPPVDPRTGALRLDPADLPAWELPPLTEEDPLSPITGPIDLLTFQSRRIRLEYDAQGQSTGYHLSFGRTLADRSLAVGVETSCETTATGLPRIVMEEDPRLPLWERWHRLDPDHRPLAFDWAAHLAGPDTQLRLTWTGVQYRLMSTIQTAGTLRLDLPASALADADMFCELLRVYDMLRAWPRYDRALRPEHRNAQLDPARNLNAREEACLALDHDLTRMLAHGDTDEIARMAHDTLVRLGRERWDNRMPRVAPHFDTRWLTARQWGTPLLRLESDLRASLEGWEGWSSLPPERRTPAPVRWRDIQGEL